MKSGFMVTEKLNLSVSKAAQSGRPFVHKNSMWLSRCRVNQILYFGLVVIMLKYLMCFIE